MTDANEYQRRAAETAIFPKEHAREYLLLGLASESGELAGKVKKVIRDKNGVFEASDIHDIKAEAGDVAWYLAMLLEEFDIRLTDALDYNLTKLKSRSARGQIIGSGDNR